MTSATGTESVSDRATNSIVNSYDATSFSARRRGERFAQLVRTFPDLGSMRVLDLGGDLRSWQLTPVRPRELVLLNITEQAVTESWASARVGDACDLGPEWATETFDLVYSNSVIEHVGGHARRAAFAAAVRGLAPRHWVQTPYRYFPVEPHWLFPGFQFLPLRAKVEVTRRWPLGHRGAADREQAIENTLGVELLCATDMEHYFPDSEIRRERFGGLVKSLIAVRTA